MVFDGFCFGFSNSRDKDVIVDRHNALKSSQGSVEALLKLFWRRWNTKWHSGPTVSAPQDAKGCEEATLSVQLDMPKTIVSVYYTKDFCFGQLW